MSGQLGSKIHFNSSVLRYLYIWSDTIRGEGWEKREEAKLELSRSMGQLSAQGQGSAIPVDTHTY